MPWLSDNGSGILSSDCLNVASHPASNVCVLIHDLSIGMHHITVNEHQYRLSSSEALSHPLHLVFQLWQYELRLSHGDGRVSVSMELVRTGAVPSVPCKAEAKRGCYCETVALQQNVGLATFARAQSTCCLEARYAWTRWMLLGAVEY